MTEQVKKKRRIPFWGTFFTLCGIVILCFLGNWQIKRYGWKLELLAKIDRQYDVDASKIDLDIEDLKGYTGIKRGTLTGIYSHNLSFQLQPRTHKGQAGYNVITPFIVKGGQGQAILVNRGWIPHERDRSEPFLMDMPMGEVNVEGMLRRPPRHNVFTPENDPAREVWYRIDMNEISLAKKIDLLPDVMFYAEKEQSRLRDYPVLTSNLIKFSNNHLQYAFFWFAMALTLFIVYVFRFIKQN